MELGTYGKLEGKRLFVFSFGCRSYFLQIWCRLYFLSVFGHQSIFYGSSKGCLYFLVIFLREVRGIQAEFGRKQDDRWLQSRALEHTPASGAIARSARCTARAARGEHVRRALPARASGAGGAAQESGLHTRLSDDALATQVF